MTKLTDPATFNLAKGDLVVAIVQAINVVGASDPSPENTVGALAQVPPSSPPTAPTRGPTTSGTQLVLDWAAVTADGGSPILGYGVEVNSGAGFVLQVDTTALTATLTSLLDASSASTPVASGTSY